MTRVLYDARTGRLSKGVTCTDHTMKIAAAMNCGAIAVSDNRQERYVVSDAASFALDF